VGVIGQVYRHGPGAVGLVCSKRWNRIVIGFVHLFISVCGVISRHTLAGITCALIVG